MRSIPKEGDKLRTIFQDKPLFQASPRQEITTIPQEFGKWNKPVTGSVSSREWR